jgi:two-component system LytT family response regulator
MRAYLVDDEPLALKRLSRLLAETGRVEIVGTSSDPVRAAQEVSERRPDVLFLDIEMPGLTGFELLATLDYQPLVVFTTAYDRYALRAFEVNSIDYLLKPVEQEQLSRALGKLERILRGAEPRADLRVLVAELTRELEKREGRYLDRLASRVGDRVEFVQASAVTHFYAKDKLTYAAAGGRQYVVDQTVAELEQKLDPRRFIRIHRSTIVNADAIKELYHWFGGRMLVRLKDGKTELGVSRERVAELKAKLGL